jgi:hypothetical protein
LRICPGRSSNLPDDRDPQFLEEHMKRDNREPDLLADARAAIVAALMEQSPLTIPELPHRWPVTRPLLLHVLRDMLREGLVAPVPGGWVPGQTSYALTEAGRRGTRDDVIPPPISEDGIGATVSKEA